MNSELLKALYAEWRKLSPSIEIEGDERTVRLAWTNQTLQGRGNGRKFKPIETWKDLAAGQARYLVRRMREASGSGPSYRANLIARLAAELWGADWDRFLATRLQDRFGVVRAQDLEPRDARAMIEELKSRVERSHRDTEAQSHEVQTKPASANSGVEVAADQVRA